MITTVFADGKKEYEFIDYLKKRAQSSDKNVIPVVSEILDNVRENGDSAVRDYTVKFDGKAPEQARCLELPGDWQIRLGQESLWLALHPVGSLVLADSAPAEGGWSDQGSVSGTRLWRRTT